LGCCSYGLGVPDRERLASIFRRTVREDGMR
jgi:hypothetical protein